jgi:nucleotide-binding universal stress UspA family protein
MFRRIVVGVDGSDGGRDALALAALLQRAGGGELIAVHVYAYERTVDLAHAEQVEAALADELRATLVDELVRAGVSARPIVVAENSPGQALHAVAERNRAQLIVVGASHLAGADRVLVGDDALGTLHGAPCAVAVAPHGFAATAHELRLIGVAVDGSPESAAAFDLACELRRRAGARLRTITVPGTPWKELSSRSANLDLLVIGSRAHGPLRRVLLGSTSTKLVGRTACPLLVVPRDAGTRVQRRAAEASDARTVHA